MSKDHILVDLYSLSGQQSSQLNQFYGRAKYKHFYQLPAWCEAVRAYQQAKILLSYHQGELIAYSIIRMHFSRPFNRYKCYIERGPVFNSMSDLEIHLASLNDILRKSKALWLSISPYTLESDSLAEIFKRHGYIDNPGDEFSYRSTVLLDLRQELASIRANFRRSLKTQLNKAGRLEVVVEQCNRYDEFESFLSLYNQFSVDKGLFRLNEKNAELIYKSIIENNRNKLLLAKMDGKILAAISLFDAGDSVIYEWGCSTLEEQYRKLPLSHLLHWHGIQWAKNAAYQFYDFGGYWRELGDNNSINRFKTGFSKDVRSMLVSQIYNFSPVLACVEQAGSRLKRRLLKIRRTA